MPVEPRGHALSDEKSFHAYMQFLNVSGFNWPKNFFEALLGGVFGFRLLRAFSVFNGIKMSENLFQKTLLLSRCKSFIDKEATESTEKRTKNRAKARFGKIDRKVVARNMIGWRKRERTSCKIVWAGKANVSYYKCCLRFFKNPANKLKCFPRQDQV